MRPGAPGRHPFGGTLVTAGGHKDLSQNIDGKELCMCRRSREENGCSRSAMRLQVLCTILMFLFISLAGSYAAACSGKSSKGRLYLVSVGTGDADNITVKAMNTIKKSAVIFCGDGIRKTFSDLLQGKEIHSGTGILVHKTFMRKQDSPDEALKEVERISAIVRKALKEGKTVSILESGDPTIYGPKMWLMEAFEDLNPEIIPGISCFNAANAALKKGVTWGVKTRSVILTNGADIEKLAESGNAMVFFTMRIDVPGIVEKLKPYYPPETPVAIVANAGYKGKEKVILGTLASIQEKIGREKPRLYLVYVGDFLTKRYGIDHKGKAPGGKK